LTASRDGAAALGLDWTADVPALPARELLAPLPMQYARRHLVLPLGPADDGPLTVALADPMALAPRPPSPRREFQTLSAGAFGHIGL